MKFTTTINIDYFPHFYYPQAARLESAVFAFTNTNAAMYQRRWREGKDVNAACMKAQREHPLYKGEEN